MDFYGILLQDFLQDSRRDIMCCKPVAQIAEFVETNRMIEPTVAFRREKRMLVQPGGSREKLRHRNHGIVLAITVEHRNIQLRDITVGRRATGDDSRSKEAGK